MHSLSPSLHGLIATSFLFKIALHVLYIYIFFYTIASSLLRLFIRKRSAVVKREKWRFARKQFASPLPPQQNAFKGKCVARKDFQEDLASYSEEASRYVLRAYIRREASLCDFHSVLFSTMIPHPSGPCNLNYARIRMVADVDRGKSRESHRTVVACAKRFKR